jgi:hypothetical protein
MIAGGILSIAFAVAILRRGGAPAAIRPAQGADAIPARGRGGPGEPSILSPIGPTPHGKLVLRWTQVSGIDQYEASVYDMMSQKLWSSGRFHGDSIEVPQKAMKYIQPGPVHFWRVVGYRPDGTEAVSPTVQFMLTP